MKDVFLSILSVFVQKTTVYLLAERGEVEMIGMVGTGRAGLENRKSEPGDR